MMLGQSYFHGSTRLLVRENMTAITQDEIFPGIHAPKQQFRI
jgi:hypothetical protein